MAIRDRNAQTSTGGDPTAFDQAGDLQQVQHDQQQALDQMEQQRQQEQQQQREQQQQQQDNDQTQSQTSDSTNTNTNTGTTASDAGSEAKTALKSEATSTNSNTNTSTTSVDVKVSADVSSGGGNDPIGMDDDLIDLDLANSASVGNVFAATKGGEIEFNPGDDIDLSGILNNSLDGEGHDVGQVLVGNNTLNDGDTLNQPQWNNTDAVDFNPTNNGGDATSGPGVAMNGDSASAGAAAPETQLTGLRGPDFDKDGKDGDGAAADGAGANGGGNLGNWGNGGGDDSIDIVTKAESGGWMDHMNVSLNQDIIMGANVLGNSVDTTVVGGNMNSDYSFDES